MPNSISIVHFLLVYFGEGPSSRSCERGKTKFNPCSINLAELLDLKRSLTKREHT